MTVRRTTLGIACCLAVSIEPITHIAYAADYISPTSARSSNYNRPHARFGVEECSDLLIEDDSGRRVVSLCHAPLNMDPRGQFEPGSSAGSTVPLTIDATISN